jgi:hypothetical protein
MLNENSQHFDRPHRFWYALDHNVVRNWQILDWIIQRAVNDCIDAQLNPEKCPAITILKRTQLALFPNQAKNIQKYPKISTSTASLRAQCEDKLAQILKTKYLAVIGMRDLTKISEDKKRFHTEARKALTAVADMLQLKETNWKIEQPNSTKFEPGCTYLVTNGYVIEVTAGRSKSANVIVRKKTSSFFDGCQKILTQTHEQLSDTRQFVQKLYMLNIEIKPTATAEYRSELTR